MLRLIYPLYPINLHNRQVRPGKWFICFPSNEDKNGDCGGDGGGTDDSDGEDDDDDRDDQDDTAAIKYQNEKASIQPSRNTSNKPECQCMRKLNVIVRLYIGITCGKSSAVVLFLPVILSSVLLQWQSVSESSDGPRLVLTAYVDFWWNPVLPSQSVNTAVGFLSFLIMFCSFLIILLMSNVCLTRSTYGSLYGQVRGIKKFADTNRYWLFSNTHAAA